MNTFVSIIKPAFVVAALHTERIEEPAAAVAIGIARSVATSFQQPRSCSSQSAHL